MTAVPRCFFFWKCHPGVRSAWIKSQWLFISEERGEEPMTSSGGNLIGSEVNRNKWSPQCGATSIEVAGISPGPRSGTSVASAVEGPRSRSPSLFFSFYPQREDNRPKKQLFTARRATLNSSLFTGNFSLITIVTPTTLCIMHYQKGGA